MESDELEEIIKSLMERKESLSRADASKVYVLLKPHLPLLQDTMEEWLEYLGLHS